MTRSCHPDLEERTTAVEEERHPRDWADLGRRLRQAAYVAAAVHLFQSAGGRLDDGATLETSRVLDGG